MGKLLCLLILLFLLNVLVSLTVGDVVEIFNNPEPGRRLIRDDSDKVTLYDSNDKAMDDLYTSLEDYNDQKVRYSFDKPDFRKHLVDALNRIKYVEDNNFKNSKKPSAINKNNINNNNDYYFITNHKENYDNDNSELNHNVKEKNSRRHSDTDENIFLKQKDGSASYSAYKSHKSDYLEKDNTLGETVSENESIDNLNDEITDKKSNNSFSKTTANIGDENDDDDDDADDDDDDEDDHQIIISQQISDVKTLFHNNTTTATTTTTTTTTTSTKSFTYSSNKNKDNKHKDLLNNNILYATLKKKDKNLSKYSFSKKHLSHSADLKHKRSLHKINENDDNHNNNNNIIISDYNNINKDSDNNNNDINNMNENVKNIVEITNNNNIDDGNDIDIGDSVRSHIVKKKKLTKHLKDVNNNVQLKDSKKYIVANKFRKRRKQDSVKLYNNFNDINNYPFPQNSEKSRGDEIPIVVANALLGVGNTAASASSLVISGSVGSNVTTASSNDSVASVKVTDVKVVATTSSVPQGNTSVVHPVLPTVATVNVHSINASHVHIESVKTTPSVRNTTRISNLSNEAKIAQEINNFVANLLIQTGKMGNMRKELGLCRTYDVKYPIYQRSGSINEKLMVELMDCLSKIIYGNDGNQVCGEMPLELMQFLDWLLLSGVCARDEFKQFISKSGNAQRRLFLFSGNAGVNNFSGASGTLGQASDAAAAAYLDNKHNRYDLSIPTTIKPYCRKNYKHNFKNSLKRMFGTFLDDSSNNVPNNYYDVNDQKHFSKNPYEFMGGNFISDRTKRRPPPPVYNTDDQQLYNNPPFNNLGSYLALNSLDDRNNDWSRNQYIDGSEMDDERFEGDLDLIRPNNVDMARYYDRPDISQNFRRDNDVLQFETPVIYVGDDQEIEV